MSEATVDDEPPIGAVRSADRLAERTGLDVARADVEALAARGTLSAVGSYKGRSLYACPALDAVDAGELTAVVAERQAWIADSLTSREAAEQLGWDRRDFERVVGERPDRPGTACWTDPSTARRG